jgi:hypothetical protein
LLEEKIDALTKEIVALRKALEGSAAPAAAKTTTKKPAAAADEDEEEAVKPKRGRKPAAKPKADEPEHDEDEVGTAMRKAAKLDKPKIQKYIKKQGCEDLAELLTNPELFDAAFEFATAILESEGDDDDDV